MSVAHVSSRNGRKRSRNEIDTEPDDHDIVKEPERKKRKNSDASVHKITNTINQIDIKKNALFTQKTSRKRSYSQTDFAQNQQQNVDVKPNDSLISEMKECSPRKKSRRNPTHHDDEGDVLMEIRLNRKGNRSVDNKAKSVDDVLLSQSFHSRRKQKPTLSPNRVRRSGLEFCVNCGVGSVVKEGKAS